VRANRTCNVGLPAALSKIRSSQPFSVERTHSSASTGTCGRTGGEHDNSARMQWEQAVRERFARLIGCGATARAGRAAPMASTLHLEHSFCGKNSTEMPSTVWWLKLCCHTTKYLSAKAIKDGAGVHALLLRSSPCSRSSRLTCDGNGKTGAKRLRWCAAGIAPFRRIGNDAACCKNCSDRLLTCCWGALCARCS
jgi:hypothetical protein